MTELFLMAIAVDWAKRLAAWLLHTSIRNGKGLGITIWRSVNSWRVGHDKAEKSQNLEKQGFETRLDQMIAELRHKLMAEREQNKVEKARSRIAIQNRDEIISTLLATNAALNKAQRAGHELKYNDGPRNGDWNAK